MTVAANAAADEKDRLSDDEVIAQMSYVALLPSSELCPLTWRRRLFIVGGLDTTASALSRILMLLSLHPERQRRLRQEILESHAADGMEYDELIRLPFLDAVVRETLRL